MRVLVTGDCGLVGSAVAKHFVQKGDSVVGVDLREAVAGAGWRHSTREIGLLNSDDLAGIDVVVHTAAMIDLTPKDPSKLHLANVAATEHLLRLASNAGVACFVYISSQEVCWDGNPVRAGDETAPYPGKHPGPYAASKAEAERMVIAYNGQSKMLTCSLRPCGIYGVGDRVRIPAVIDGTLKAKAFTVIGSNEAKYSHTFAGNLAHAVYLAAGKLTGPGGADSPVAGSCYYITDTEDPDTFFNFTERFVVAALGPQKRSVIPYALAYVVAVVGEFLYRLPFWTTKPLLTRDGLHTIAQDFSFTSAKAARDLGYSPLFSEQEAFSTTVSWLKETKPWHA